MYCILNRCLFLFILVYKSTLSNLPFCGHMEIGGPSDAHYNTDVLGRQSTLAGLLVGCYMEDDWPGCYL